jgi:hypothetical protein
MKITKAQAEASLESAVTVANRALAEWHAWRAEIRGQVEKEPSEKERARILSSWEKVENLPERIIGAIRNHIEMMRDLPPEVQSITLHKDGRVTKAMSIGFDNGTEQVIDIKRSS